MKIQLKGVLTAAMPMPDGTDMTGRFDAVLCIEGEQTTDDREIAVGALNWRELPIALTNAEEVGDDHYGEVVGRIESVQRVNLGTKAEIRASGSFDMGSDAGVEANRLVADQMKRWVSIDLEVISYELIERGDCSVDPTPDDEIDYYPNPDCHIIMNVTDGRIMGAAVCAFSAFPGAVIVPGGTEIPAATEDGRPAPAVAAATAVYHPQDFSSWSAGSAPFVASGVEPPPAEWFTDPGFVDLERWTTVQGRRIFGHLAGKGECHIGFIDRCITCDEIAENGFDYAMLGHVVTADGSSIPTGPLSLTGGHADLSLDWRRTKAYYDDPATVVADVAYGTDEFGIWFAGALRPGVTEEQVYALRASGVSLDAREVEGKMRLIAACAVNVPGFPKLAARVASGELTALVAAGGPPLPAPDLEDCGCDQQRALSFVAAGTTRRAARTPDTDALIANLTRRLRSVERIAEPLRRAAARAILERIEVRPTTDGARNGEAVQV